MGDNVMAPSTMPTGISATGIPPNLSKHTGMEDPLLVYQYQQYRFFQNQQLLLKQMRANAINKLSQNDQWGSLSQLEQNQLVTQHVRALDPDVADLLQHQLPPPPHMQPPVLPGGFMTSIQQPVQPTPSNSVLQLFPQLHQNIPAAKPAPEPVHVPSNNPHQSQIPQNPIDPIQQLMQQMNIRNVSTMPQTPPPPPVQTPPQPSATVSEDENPIKSWLRQLGVNTNGPMPTQKHQPQPQMDSVWHQTPQQNPMPAFNAQTWMSQVGAIQPNLSGQLTGSLWDMHPKEMKTEQQILQTVCTKAATSTTSIATAATATNATANATPSTTAISTATATTSTTKTAALTTATATASTTTATAASTTATAASTAATAAAATTTTTTITTRTAAACCCC
ncbi:unnamed protein product [Trichogramma brassicae]|uniref:Uncharacterized protein n=1 Tax=Trichogramma brassicae TaxID=86971 RepID=A0A6H5IJH9_9HYME|nr:unnamed protein product [Trichogramma brassicae]